VKQLKMFYQFHCCSACNAKLAGISQIQKDSGIVTFLGNFDQILFVINDEKEVVLKKCINIR